MGAMRVADIRIKEDGARRSVNSTYLEPSGGARELSLLKSEGLAALREMGGLCTAKFDADILTSGMDISLLGAGQRFMIGGAHIEITEASKRCFDDCPLRIRGERCPLPQSCAFARVILPGSVRIGDEITPLHTP